jgi:putative membrane protein
MYSMITTDLPTAIRTTPIPIGYLIHQKQVLALYLMILPFAIVDVMGWSGVPVMALVAFTLYGMEVIGRQLEDPFGYDKMDIKFDAILQDAQTEIETLLDEWRMGRIGYN